MPQSLLQYRLQPILRMTDEVIVAHEFLCRWGSELPWLERDSALIKALYDCEQLPAEDLHINMSPDVILALAPQLIEPLCERFGRQLVLEWTEEHSSREATQVAAKRLRYWRKKYGVQISIDDFCTGHDAVRRVLISEPDSVKIDGELFRDAIKNTAYADIVRRLCGWLNDIKTKIVIEFIETESDLAFACALGAEMGQGFHWNHLASDFYFHQEGRIYDIRCAS